MITKAALQIGQIYRYGRPYAHTDEFRDGYLNYFALTYTPGCNYPLLERGINPIAPITDVTGVSRYPAVLLSSSPHKVGATSTPWQDFFDSDNGHIRYYGDNKTSGKDPAAVAGNRVLRALYSLQSAPTMLERKHAVPILFFERVKVNEKYKGFIRFQGFGVVDRCELVTQYSNGQYFSNYVFDFIVFSTQHEHEYFNWNWISARRDPSLDIDATLPFAPKSWITYVREGLNAKQKFRRRVARLYITTAQFQRPEPNSKEEYALEGIYKFYTIRGKARFEALASVITARILNTGIDQYRNGWITPASSDGGSDFIGRLDIGSAFAKTSLIVLGQAKCEKLDSPTSGRDVARTVARLKRGWVGVYVTTSYFSEAVQQEVIEDAYPIVCIHGLRLAQECIQLAHEKAMSIGELLQTIDSEYDNLVQVRRPEEILLMD